MDIPQLCEIGMLVLFGLSWPFNIAKSLRSKTAKGKSLLFELIILAGYALGLAGKFFVFAASGVLAYSVWFYLADILMVLADLCLSLRNRRLDRMRERCAAI